MQRSDQPDAEEAAFEQSERRQQSGIQGLSGTLSLSPVSAVKTVNSLNKPELRNKIGLYVCLLWIVGLTNSWGWGWMS